MVLRILLTLIIIVAMFPESVPENIFPGPTLLSLLSLIFLIINASQLNKCDPKVTRLSSISICLLLFYGWGALGYFFTGSLDISYSSIFRYLGVIFLYLGLIIFVKDEGELLMPIWIALFCAAIHSFFLFAATNYYPHFPSIGVRAWTKGITHFVNPNILSSYLLFFIPQAFYLSTCSCSIVIKNIARYIFVLLLLALLFSWARGGMAAVILQFSVMTVYLLYKKDSARVKNLLILILTSTIIYFAVNFYVNNRSQFFNISTITSSNLEKVSLSSKLEKISRSSELETVPSSSNKISSLDIRIHYWQGALGIINDHWIAGSGPGTFPLIAPLYLYAIKDQRAIELGRKFASNPSSAHNLFLNIASESGVVGLCLLLAVIFFVCSKSYSFLQNTPRRVHEPVFYAVVSIIGYLFHNLVEFNWYPSEFIYSFTILIFVIEFNTRIYTSTSTQSEIVGLRGFPVVVWGVILVGSVVAINYYLYLKIIKPDNSFINEKVHMWENKIDRANILCPKCSDPFLIMGKGLLIKYYSTYNPLYLAGSKQQFDTAIQKNPLDLRPLPYLAQSLTLQKKFQEAKDICYKLLKYQRYEFTGRMELAIIMLVESYVAKNSLSGPKQIVEAWEQAAKKVGFRRNRVAEGLGKAIERRKQFMQQKD